MPRNMIPGKEVHKAKGRIFTTQDGILETKLTNKERRRRAVKRQMAKISRKQK